MPLAPGPAICFRVRRLVAGGKKGNVNFRRLLTGGAINTASLWVRLFVTEGNERQAGYAGL